MSAERLLVPPLCAPFTPGAPEPHSDPQAEMETLRTIVNQRMAAAVDEILEVFVKTVVRYRDQIDLQRQQLDSLRAADVHWNRAADPLQASPWIKPCPDDLNVQLDHRDSLDHHDGLNHLEPLDHSGNLVHPDSLDHPESMDQPEVLDQIDATTLAAHIKTEAGSLDCGEPTVHLVGISDGASDDRLLADCSETDDSGDYWREAAGLWKPEETREHQGTSLCSKEKNFSLLAPQVRPVFTCKVCGESFQRISYLFTHSSAHLMDCGLCGRHLEHSENLKLHLKVHRKASFRCGVCGQSFTLRGNLRTHMRIHSGERPFACTICGKSFGRRATLVRHVRSHTGEKPFTCTYCGRGFVEKGNLTVHLRTHTGERPYWCSNCDRRFSQLSCFYKHPCQRSHLNIEDPNT